MLLNKIATICPQPLVVCKPKPTVNCKNCSYVCVCVCVHIIVHNYHIVHNAALNSFDNLPSHPPDSHHCSAVVYWMTEYCN